MLCLCNHCTVIVIVTVAIIHVAKCKIEFNQMKLTLWAKKMVCARNSSDLSFIFFSLTHWHIHLANLLYRSENVYIMLRWFEHLCTRFYDTEPNLCVHWFRYLCYILCCTVLCCLYSTKPPTPFRRYFFSLGNTFHCIRFHSLFFSFQLQFSFCISQPSVIYKQSKLKCLKNTCISQQPNGMPKNVLAR